MFKSHLIFSLFIAALPACATTSDNIVPSAFSRNDIQSCAKSFYGSIEKGAKSETLIKNYFSQSFNKLYKLYQEKHTEKVKNAPPDTKIPSAGPLWFATQDAGMRRFIVQEVGEFESYWVVNILEQHTMATSWDVPEEFIYEYEKQVLVIEENDKCVIDDIVRHRSFGLRSGFDTYIKGIIR